MKNQEDTRVDGETQAARGQDLPRSGNQPSPSLRGVELIAAERQRQVEAEGWTLEHDDAHCDSTLTRAAISYASAAYTLPYLGQREVNARDVGWPWEDASWKPSDDPIRNLVKAGALIAAEIDRLLRRQALAAPQSGSMPCQDSWQSIETAPKHQAVLAFYEKYGEALTARKGERGWSVAGLSENYVVHVPSHWMPLPNPPSSLSASAQGDANSSTSKS